MKNLIIACLLIISVLTAGCGGGGGSSTKPTVIVTAPTISEVATETTSSHTVATISGIGFGSPVSSSYVTYDGTPYFTKDWYDNKIVVMIPSTTIDPYKLRVVVNNVTSNPPLNATSNMRIFSITPSSGNPGT
ncbi:MAG TPA: IPT/TIG domain-containing protein, partial [Candidatus Rifleibacterium sp.]|nr:IPT/TIG domain-containing protein [Candidatus Rifleibacterium sp.]